MDQVLRGPPFAYDYIDDILVASATEEEQTTHVHTCIAVQAPLTPSDSTS